MGSSYTANGSTIRPDMLAKINDRLNKTPSFQAGLVLADAALCLESNADASGSASSSDDAVQSAQAAPRKAFRLTKHTIKHKRSVDAKNGNDSSDGPKTSKESIAQKGNARKSKDKAAFESELEDGKSANYGTRKAKPVKTRSELQVDNSKKAVGRSGKLDSLQRRKNQELSRGIMRAKIAGKVAAESGKAAVSVATGGVYAAVAAVGEAFEKAFDYLSTIAPRTESTDLGILAFLSPLIMVAPLFFILSSFSMGGGIGYEAAVKWMEIDATTDISEAEMALATTLRSSGYGSIQIAAILGNAYVDTGCDCTYLFMPEHSPTNQVSYGMFPYTHTYLVCDCEKANLDDGTCDFCRYFRWCVDNNNPPGNVNTQLYWTFSQDEGWQDRGAWWNLWYASRDYVGTVRLTSPDAQLDTTWESFANEIDLASAVYSWMAGYVHPAVNVCDYPARLERALEVFRALAPEGWSFQNGAYYYYNDDGTVRTNDWATYDGQYYYLDEDGRPVIDGWVRSDGEYYYMDENGNPIVNGWVYSGGNYYYMGSDGTPVIDDWVYSGGKWYCMDSNGNPVIDGWVETDGKYYYLDSNGNLVTDGWAYSGGQWYYMDANGNPVTDGWVEYNGRYYYVNSSGNPVTDAWVKSNGKYYYLNSAGNPVTDGWVKYNGNYYYLNSSGNPVVNDWVEYDGNYYYMDANGNPVTDTWWQADDGTWYRFDSDGVCHQA